MVDYVHVCSGGKDSAKKNLRPASVCQVFMKLNFFPVKFLYIHKVYCKFYVFLYFIALKAWKKVYVWSKERLEGINLLQINLYPLGGKSRH